MNKLTTIKGIKGFVKRASGTAITDWLAEIYRNGYRQGRFDQMKEFYEENNSDIESTESPEEQPVDGEGTVD